MGATAEWEISQGVYTCAKGSLGMGRGGGKKGEAKKKGGVSFHRGGESFFVRVNNMMRKADGVVRKHK